MVELIKRYRLTLPIIRKDFQRTRSAKFEGKLLLISNIHGVIYDWKIIFSNVFIDLMTTESWFKIRNGNFERRDKLFKELKLKQQIRPSRTSNNILKLNQDQLNILNNFLNDRTKYKSTIKNIISIIKGNNPSGEAKNPRSAEMIINENGPYKNFVILIDDLIMKISKSRSIYEVKKRNNDYDIQNVGAINISLEKFAKLNPDLESAFNFLQKEKNDIEFQSYLNNIKEYYKNYNTFANLGNVLANKARSQYINKIKNNITQLPFGFVNNKQFQKCHIEEFRDLRDLIIYALKNNKSYSHYLERIKDYENFLPLPESIHRQFDRNVFTYDLKGQIKPLSCEGKKFIANLVDEKFFKIPKFFLTVKRMEYIKRRNENINNFR